MRNFLVLLAWFYFVGFPVAQTTVTYSSSSVDFPNPERGFYRYSETRSSNYTLLDQTTLEGYRQLTTPPTAGYSVYSTLVFRYFFLEDFKMTEISAAYLANIQTDFNTARLAGVKLIPRFAYTDEVDPSGCGSFICPPYGDAPKSWVVAHINQLAPILETNKDVIAAFQMGFVGVWGENYYTDYFGDASLPPDYKLSDQNWTDRNDVLNALLTAVPAERMIQVRYPQLKQRNVYGINALTTASPLTTGEAFSGANKARLGFHNDCLLASADDYGTYADYGNSSTSSSSDTTTLKPYFSQDSKYVVVGGETCDDTYSPQNDCSATNAAAYGDTELARMHYSYLNAQYNNEVNNDWQTGGCMDDIKRRLGYRFELQDGQYSNAVQPDQVIGVNINLKNIGYAAPYNERAVELILRNTTSSDLWFATIPEDPRFWLASNTIYNMTHSICIPTDMPLGNYEVLLNLPDPMPSLYANPAYAIRVANLLPDNSDLWESLTGYNKLGHTIAIDNTSSNAACNGEVMFSQVSTILPVELLGFSATPKDEEISLDWWTANEQNNEGFYLQRSKDGRVFSNLKWLDGHGSTHATHHYQVVDRQVEPNVNYYYCLAQKDFDGTITRSKIVRARISGDVSWSQFKTSVTVYPNPAHQEIRIDWARNTTEEVSVSLLNTLGQTVISPSLNVPSLDISAQAPGLYFTKLSYQGKSLIRKITIQ